MKPTQFPRTTNRDMPPGPSTPLHLGKRLFRTLASLRLAIVLLSLFAICLAGATLIESRYGTRIAQELIYRSWWFALLLGLLAINVLCAALKKYPWKRHQTGFLITHAGLLILLAGGLLTTLFGVEGQMVLIDSPDPAVQARVGLSNQARSIHLTGAQRIEVYRLKRPRGVPAPQLLRLVRALDRGEEMPEETRDCVDRAWKFPFSPGPFAWHSDEHVRLRLPWELAILYALACPSPDRLHDLDERATFAVNNFYPHTERAAEGGGIVPSDIPPGAEDDGGLGPAIRCTLSGSAGTEEFQVVLSRPAARVRLGDDFYLVRYCPDVRPLDFTLTLQRARQRNDPGSDRSAWFQSDVTVTAERDGRSQSREHSIVMNHPLQDGPYKIYQINYRALIDPDTLMPILDGRRQVSLSGLTVACDPGLWLKYAGSLTVVLGIATMFYMRAYFFRRREPSPAA
jgi:hypothetical protein